MPWASLTGWNSLTTTPAPASASSSSIHPFDRTLWAPQLDALHTTFRVVAPDLRGFGQSPVVRGQVTMREYAADIEELLDKLGITRAAVVGLSMGGLVAMESAVADPQRYWALGLVATTAEPPSRPDRMTREERAFPRAHSPA
jgi:3-oxoadipate enol-lactonase